LQIKICRKESKESRYRLRLIAFANPEFDEETKPLIQVMKIFGAILGKGS
jgi:hypothetical protein